MELLRKREFRNLRRGDAFEGGHVESRAQWLRLFYLKFRF